MLTVLGAVLAALALPAAALADGEEYKPALAGQSDDRTLESRETATYRATPLDDASVAPGRTGTFTFVVRAPEVDAVAVLDEYFSPVADPIRAL